MCAVTGRVAMEPAATAELDIRGNGRLAHHKWMDTRHALGYWDNPSLPAASRSFRWQDLCQILGSL